MTENRKFHQLSIPERKEWLKKHHHLTDSEVAALCGNAGLSVEQADKMVENAVGTYALPIGIAQHFIVNGREVLVPMVIEEPSVIAGASYMAKLAQSTGGFSASSDEPVMIGQMQILNCPDLHKARVKNTESQKGTACRSGNIRPCSCEIRGWTERYRSPYHRRFTNRFFSRPPPAVRCARCNGCQCCQHCC